MLVRHVEVAVTPGPAPRLGWAGVCQCLGMGYVMAVQNAALDDGRLSDATLFCALGIFLLDRVFSKMGWFGP
jgi:hypothetical protein